jgi:hypothetical protein
MISQSYSVTDTRQVVVSADNQNRTLYVQIIGNSTVYLGGSNVTDSNGMPVAKHEAFHEIFVPIGQTLYAVCASGVTETLRILLPDVD